ncbi:MAG: PhoU domain-containing protein [Candidatus Jordarchaeum sp.]|uniref:PhoU domain-containing protein n=1 Tax=Candidatus Jordarchaeum sp. TaxID=2823881 RepID=UPI00404B9825
MSTVEKNEGLEFRKVQTLGKSSYLISLPKNWVEKNRIKKGDKLAIQETSNGVLRILLAHQERSQQRSINKVVIDDLDKAELEAAIIGNYVMGVDNLKIVTKQESLTTSQRKIIRNSLNKLLGFRVISESTKSIDIRNILDPNNLDVREEVTRLVLLSSFMLKDLIQALKEKNLEMINEIIEQDNEIDRSYLAMRRLLMVANKNAVIARRIGVEGSNLCIAWSIILKRIETIADYVVEIVKILYPIDLSKIPEELYWDFLKIGEHVSLVFEKFLKFFTEKDKTGAPTVMRDIDLFLDMKNAFTQKAIEKSLDPTILVSLENACFFFNEIANYLMDHVKDLINFVTFF